MEFSFEHREDGQLSISTVPTDTNDGKVKPLKRKLSLKEKNYIAFCETFYFMNKAGFPTPEQAAVVLRYSVPEIQTFLQNKTVQDALERRGLPWKFNGAKSGNLSPTQVAAAMLMTNWADSRLPAQRLNDLGILPETYRAWLEDPVFNSYVNSLADRTLQNIRPEAITEFARLVRGGDLNAIKYYFEVTGEFQGAQTQNLQGMLQLVIDTIVEFVKDPVVLAQISQRLLNAVPGVSAGVQVKADTIIQGDFQESNAQALTGWSG